ncbi:zinc finger CCCH-type antiviral protein 1-like [Pseudophryne corroboree]|uniref:zinc finger CCCH-type antiviral protein 1-like n=1 Tax=Pseudophryne corroboree TaxID=495146 RepID=UPI0030820345
MSDPTVTAFLTKLLCSHGGRLPRERLTQLLELPPEQIGQILQDELQRFPQVGELVLAQSPVRICRKYLKKEEEEECGSLHLCREYMRGTCWPDMRCPRKLSHDILSDHNQMVLKDNELSGLNDQELKVLLLQNDNQLLPEMCRQYWNGTCDQGNACTRLHVCGYFMRGECNRQVCKNSHNLLEANPDLLHDRHKLPVDAVQNFQMLCVIKHNLRHQDRGRDVRRGAPRGRGGRGRGRAKSRNRPGSQDILQDRSRGRQMEGTGFQDRGRSSSRPASESGESHHCWSEDDDDGQQKTELEKLMEDWFTPETPGSGNTHVGSERRPKLTAPPSNARKVRPRRSDTTIPNAAQARTERLSSASSDKAMSAPSAPLTGASEPIGPSRVPPTSLGRLNSNYSVDGDSIRGGPNTSSPTALTGSTKPVNTPISATCSASPSSQPYYSRINRPTTSAITPSVTVTQFGGLYQPGAQSRCTIRAEQVSPAASSNAMTAPTDALQNSSQPLGPSNVPPTSPVGLTSYQPTRLSGASSVSSTVSNDLNERPSGVPPVTPRALSTATAPANAAASPLGGTSSLRASSFYSDTSRLSEGADHSSKLLASVKPVSRPDLSQLSGTRSADEVSQHQPLARTSPDRPTLSRKSTPEKNPDICLSNIWMYCRLGGKCPDMHFYLPYRWQVFNREDWEDIPNMENVEKAYCDPKVARIPLVDFETFKSGTNLVRRLSTPSSVTKPPEYVMTTEWIWYWKDEYGNWTQYGQSNIKNVSSTILSADLESIYLSDPIGIIPFTAGQQQYEINFREMKQRNTVYRTEKDVCRRPKFLNFEDVKTLKGRTKSTASKTPVSPLKSGIYPRDWDTAAVPEIGHKKVAVSETSSEFTSLVKMFSMTLSGKTVKRIWRIQNPSLWQIYQWQNEQMKKANPGKVVSERQLFHGTDSTHLDAICNQNFDWRICGTHGTVYGQGSYFARDASYSHNYSVPTSSGKRTMFIARVLVGDYVTGDPNMKRPPLKPNRIQSYDSCVDNIYNPSIFVVFDKLQIYPEYVLEYEEEQKKSCVIS